MTFGLGEWFGDACVPLEAGLTDYDLSPVCEKNAVTAVVNIKQVYIISLDTKFTTRKLELARALGPLLPASHHRIAYECSTMDFRVPWSLEIR